MLFATFAAGADVAFPEARVTIHVNGQAALLGELSGQIDRKTKLLMQIEGGFGGDDSAAGGRGAGGIIEHAQAALDGGEKVCFFLLDDSRDLVGIATEFGEGVAHLLSNDGNEAIQKRLA